MSPRLEYAVSAGALAVTLGLLALHLFGFGMADAIVWQVGAAAGAAATGAGLVALVLGLQAVSDRPAMAHSMARANGVRRSGAGSINVCLG